MLFVDVAARGSVRPGLPAKPAALSSPRRASGKCLCVFVDMLCTMEHFTALTHRSRCLFPFTEICKHVQRFSVSFDKREIRGLQYSAVSNWSKKNAAIVLEEKDPQCQSRIQWIRRIVQHGSSQLMLCYCSPALSLKL